MPDSESSPAALNPALTLNPLPPVQLDVEFRRQTLKRSTLGGVLAKRPVGGSIIKSA